MFLSMSLIGLSSFSLHSVSHNNKQHRLIVKHARVYSIIPKTKAATFDNNLNYCATHDGRSSAVKPVKAELSTARVDPRVASSWVGSGQYLRK